jgi:polyisoprenoid-binding protein YceI
MKRLALLTGILALSAPLALAQTPAQLSTWSNDPAHSEVDFSIKHLGISNVHGRFGKVAATILLNDADITRSTVTATIDVATVDTGEPARDNHLKTDAFFDVAKFPTATFASTSVVKGGSGLTVTGNLTLHGVTKPVVLDVEGPGATVQGMDHKTHTGYSATTIISRTAFGIGSQFPAAMVGDDVKLTIELDVAKQ